MTEGNGSGSRYTPPAARTSATVTGGQTPIVPGLTGEALTTGLMLPALTAAGWRRRHYKP